MLESRSEPNWIAHPTNTKAHLLVVTTFKAEPSSALQLSYPGAFPSACARGAAWHRDARRAPSAHQDDMPSPLVSRESASMTTTLPFSKQLGLFARLAGGLGPFLRDRLTAERCTEMSRSGLARREASFIGTLESALTSSATNPYSKLLAHAGITLRDIRESVRRSGLEPTLEMLYDNGVYVSLDEFKGRVPIRRGSLCIEIGSHDFDNPLARAHIETRTGGSRSTGTRLFIDLDLLERDAGYVHHQMHMFGLYGRPLFVWCSAAPALSGISEVLRCAKLGVVPQRWFAQSVPSLRDRSWRHAVLTRYVVRAARANGCPIPAPEKLPLNEAWVAAEALAEARRRGERPVFRANSSTAVRVCLAAEERGLDISGTTMRVSAEPFTPGKAAVLRRTGCTAASWYATGETGIIGLPCSKAAEIDEVHLMADKLAMIRRERQIAPGRSVLVNVYSTLVPSVPKLMLNFVSDDYADVGERSCGCPLEALGYTTHMHTIRSWEKLTSEGMTFIGHDLIRLIEEVLPARFGGTPADYQFVEDERDGLPRVDLLVSPRVGPLDENVVRAAVLEFLDDTQGAQTRRADPWRQARTVSVIRKEPIATAASKVLALHVMRAKRERGAA